MQSMLLLGGLKESQLDIFADVAHSDMLLLKSCPKWWSECHFFLPLANWVASKMFQPALSALLFSKTVSL